MMECLFKQEYNLFELNRELDIITEKIKDLGDPITYSEIRKIRRLDEKKRIINLKIRNFVQKKKGKGFRKGFNLIGTHIMGKTYPELIESNLSDLQQKVKDLKNNNYNLSAILDVQTYARSITDFAKALQKETGQ